MSLRRRIRKALAWGLLLALAVLVGGAIAAYHYVTDSETLAELIRREAPRFLPGCLVDVSRAQVWPVAGEVSLRGLLVRKPDGGPDPTVGSAHRVKVRYDPWAMVRGRFEPREVELTGPTLRLRRLADGSWNLQGLLADPWPIPTGGAIPSVAIQKGTLELSEGGDRPALTLLTDVTAAIPAAAPGAPVAFELTARGPAFERVRVEGQVEPGTGRVEIRGGTLARLDLSKSLRGRLPAPAREALEAAGLDAGEVDATLGRLAFDPSATPRLRYAASARLRRGLWQCPRLPFPIGDLSAEVEAVDGRLTVVRASGTDGATSFGLRGRATIGDPARVPFEARLEATNLELDDRLRRFTPPKHQEVWALYFPDVGRPNSPGAGRVDAVLAASRPAPGAAIAAEVDVEARDVSVKYRHFAYPVDHVRGKLHATKEKLTLDLRAPLGSGSLRIQGEVDDPGPRADARLTFTADALPVDEALLQAMAPDVRKVVDDFKPTGMVRGKAELRRRPPLRPEDDPKGRVQFDAWVDLIPGPCSVTWKELKYPVRNLVGQLEIHPDHWILRGLRGNNGQASISASGEVRQVRRNQFKVALEVRAENLPFDQQLRDALKRPWQVTWATLNPTGATDLRATIDIDPDRTPRPDHNRVEITPRDSTGVKLEVHREPRPGVDLGGKVVLKMDDVTGRFVFDTTKSPPTEMSGVGFTFQGSPVGFAFGQVDVKDNGEFQLGVSRIEVSNLRLDEALRRKMPPEMASFSRRLVDGRIPKIRADLGLGWSGKAGESPWCRWDDARVILTDNKLEVGSALGLEHIQGELYPVRGRFDGRSLEVHAQLDLASVTVLGQQVTGLTADLDVRDGWATLDRIKGSVLGGALNGRLRASLEATPRYSAALSVEEAELFEFAKTQPGHQGYRGLVNGWFEVSGQGPDPHTITGMGAARVVQGDLGTLPLALQFLSALKLAKNTKAAFDSADVAFKIHNGETTMDPVRFSGNAFSLNGKGKLDVRGELDLKLRILAGRDAWHVPLFSDVTRELSGQILVIRVQGPYAAPTFKPEAIPLPGEIFRARKAGRPGRKLGLERPWGFGSDSRIRAALAARWRAPAE